MLKLFKLTKKNVLILFGAAIVIIAIVLLAVFLSPRADLNILEPIIYTTSGRIYGVNHEYYYSFESIPFAKPPIGPNRFEPPIPYKSKADINGTLESPFCMQWLHSAPDNYLVGQEDCLYLSVYTPQIRNVSELYPIVITIHGGAFMFGGSMHARVQHIMNYKNTIVVQINYRLGPLGFLSTGDDQISGNMGLKDQQLALIWIKNNAKSFNGDPNKIVLTGFSAGGASVHFHVLSQKSKQLNLFNSAISFSGTAYCPWVIVPQPLDRTRRLAELINCPSDSTKNIKNCLKTKPAMDIVSAVKKFQPFLYYPFRVFGPVIENSTAENVFINEEPTAIIRNRKFFEVPYLISTTRNEGGYNAADLMITNNNGSTYFEEFLERFDELAPVALFYEETMSESAKNSYTLMLKEQYQLFNLDPLIDRYMRLQEIFSQKLFLIDARRTVQLHRDFSSKAVYNYMYDNPATFGVGNKLSHNAEINFGSVHGDDYLLIFGGNGRGGREFRSDEKIISSKLINMVRNFAITGKLTYGDIDVPQNVKNINKVITMKIYQNQTLIDLVDD